MGFEEHEIMSFSRSIGRTFPEAIDKDVSEVGEFLEKRLQMSQLFWPVYFVQNYLRNGESAENRLYTKNADEGFAQQFGETSATSPWPRRSDIERDLFAKVSTDENKKSD